MVDNYNQFNFKFKQSQKGQLPQLCVFRENSNMQLSHQFKPVHIDSCLQVRMMQASTRRLILPRRVDKRKIDDLSKRNMSFRCNLLFALDDKDIFQPIFLSLQMGVTPIPDDVNKRVYLVAKELFTIGDTKLLIGIVKCK